MLVCWPLFWFQSFQRGTAKPIGWYSVARPDHRSNGTKVCNRPEVKISVSSGWVLLEADATRGTTGVCGQRQTSVVFGGDGLVASWTLDCRKRGKARRTLHLYAYIFFLASWRWISWFILVWYLSTYVPTYLSTESTYLPIYLSIFWSFYFSILLYFYISIFLSIFLSIYLSVYLSIYLSIYLSNLSNLSNLSIYLSTYLSIYLSRYLDI